MASDEEQKEEKRNQGEIFESLNDFDKNSPAVVAETTEGGCTREEEVERASEGKEIGACRATQWPYSKKATNKRANKQKAEEARKTSRVLATGNPAEEPPTIFVPC